MLCIIAAIAEVSLYLIEYRYWLHLTLFILNKWIRYIASFYHIIIV